MSPSGPRSSGARHVLRRGAPAALAGLLLAGCSAASSAVTVPGTPPSRGASTSVVVPPSAGRTGPTRVYAGHYLGGFETSSFLPCGQRGQPGYAVGWWLDAEEPSGFFARVHAVLGPEATAPYTPDGRPGARVVFVRFEGTLEEGDPHGYGHLNAYRKQVHVQKVLDAVRGGTCPGLQGAPPS